MNAESAAYALLRTHYDAAAVQQHEMLDDGQAESCATHHAIPRSVDAIETLEHEIGARLRDADAGVFHFEQHATSFWVRTHGDASASAVELDRIVHEVLQNLLEATASCGTQKKLSPPRSRLQVR